MQARNKFCNDKMMNCLLKSQCIIIMMSWWQLPSDFTTTMSTTLEPGLRKTNRNISIDKARCEVLSETLRDREQKKKLNQFGVERFDLIIKMIVIVILLVDIINLLIINLNECLVAAHVFQLRSFQVLLRAMQFYSNKLNIFFQNNNMPGSHNNLSANMECSFNTFPAQSHSPLHYTLQLVSL